MAEQVGTLLWEMRTAAGWSLAQLAQKAGVSKSALFQWESGARQPRIPELEATLGALEVSPAQRALVFARMDAPRALRRLNTPGEPSGLGAPPSAGDLLRALRLRGGWTQVQLAHRLGVGQNTVARWERGERLPSNEQMQTLCFALEAREEEIVVLTTGRFTEATDRAMTWEEAEPLLRRRAEWWGDHKTDLLYLALEYELWTWAAREERAVMLLAYVYGYHAMHCRNQSLWSQVEPLAERALALVPRQEHEPDPLLRAALSTAAAAVYGGQRLAPERGLQRLEPWLTRSAQPEMTAWLLSDFAKYLAMDGRTEAALTLAQQACQTAEAHDDPIELYLRRCDYGRLLLEAGRPCDALRVLPAPKHDYPAIETDHLLTMAEAHLQAGSAFEAKEWLQRAYDRIETHCLDLLRSKADALAQRL